MEQDPMSNGTGNLATGYGEVMQAFSPSHRELIRAI